MKEKKKNIEKNKDSEFNNELASLIKEHEKLKEEIQNLQNKIQEQELTVHEAGIAIFVCKPQGHIIDVNENAVKLTGYTKDQLKQLSIEKLFDKPELITATSKKTSQTSAGELKLIQKSGKKIYVSVIVSSSRNEHYNLIVRDIHKQKIAELALIESEHRFRMLTENMYDVVWTTDLNLKTIFISSSITKLTGFKPEFYYHKPIKDLVTNISYRIILDTFRIESEKLKGKQTPKNQYYISLDIKLLHKTKGSIWVNMKTVILQNKLGEIIGYQGVFRDIEDKKQILQTLKEHKKKYNFALETTQASVWELDPDLIKINCDKHIFKLLGYPQKSNLLFRDWINTVYPDDRMYVIDILESILEKKITHKTYECRRIHKDNYVLWFKEHAKAIIDENGKVKAILGSSKNITAEKRIEDKKFKYYAGLQLLIDSAIQFLQLKTVEECNNYIGETLIKLIPNSVIIIGKINEEQKLGRAQSVYGANRQKLLNEFKELSWNPFESDVSIPENFIQKVKQRSLIKYQDNFFRFFEEISGLQADSFIKSKFNFKDVYILGIVAEKRIFGTIVILLEKNARIASPDFLEAFIYIASINMQKRYIEKELQKQKLALLKSEKKYKKLNATKDKFFSLISHDLKNPFNTIIGFAGLIMNNYEKLDREKIKEFSKLIYEAANSSYEMMQNLLQWAKSQRGKIKPIFKELNINELIDANIKLFASDAIKKEITVNFVPAKNSIIKSDYNIVDTVIRNLLSNALKFSKRKGTIQITVNDYNDYFQISVSDNGIGIPDEKKSKIFKIEAGKVTYGTDQERGSGLGLILCKEFIDILGGKIWFESTEGKGSTFHFTIPLKQK